MKTQIDDFKDKLHSLAKPIRMVDYITTASKLRIRDDRGVAVISDMVVNKELRHNDLAESLKRHLGLL